MSDDETVHTFEVILGIQLVNDFEINPFLSCDQDYGYEKKQGPSIRGLFALASMPSHNCVANCSHEFSSRYVRLTIGKHNNWKKSFVLFFL